MIGLIADIFTILGVLLAFWVVFFQLKAFQKRSDKNTEKLNDSILKNWEKAQNSFVDKIEAHNKKKAEQAKRQSD